MAVHAALLTSVEVVATGAAATAEGAMMMGMAMGAGAVAVAGGRPQHLPPSVQPPAWQFPIFLHGLVCGVEAFQVAHASPGAGAVATLCLCHCSSHNWLALESVEPLLLDSHPA